MTTVALTDRPATADLPTTGSAPAARPRLGWVDCTRGVAIIAVLLYHGLGYLKVHNHLNGQAGVDAFLLLSGFGLAYSLRDEPWYAFLWRRLVRMLPAYWIVFGLCVAFLYGADVRPTTRQIVLNVTCLHLLAGGSHGMAINMSFWFMGLIVPLYLWFAVIRRWLAGRAAYWVLGGSVAVAWAIGGYMFEHPDAPATIAAALGRVPASWGPLKAAAAEVAATLEVPWDVGHIPDRLPEFFVGAMFGLMVRRRDPADRLLAEPGAMLAFALLVPVSLACRWTNFTVSLAMGFGVVAVGAFFSGLGDRWRACRPAVLLLTGLGAVSYELFLCHQFILIDVQGALLTPKLERWLPNLSHVGRETVGLCVSYAAAVWLAFGLRWVVAPRESRRTWRPTAAALLMATVALAVVAVVVPATHKKMRPREIRVAVAVDAPPALPLAEPVLVIGSTGSADMVLLEHDGAGRARVGIDHWNYPVVYSDWVPVRALVAAPWVIRVDERRVDVRAGPAGVRSEMPPYQPTAKTALGRNDIGFSTAAREATSKLTRLQP